MNNVIYNDDMKDEIFNIVKNYADNNILGDDTILDYLCYYLSKELGMNWLIDKINEGVQEYEFIEENGLAVDAIPMQFPECHGDEFDEYYNMLLETNQRHFLEVEKQVLNFISNNNVKKRVLS